MCIGAGWCAVHNLIANDKDGAGVIFFCVHVLMADYAYDYAGADVAVDVGDAGVGYLLSVSVLFNDFASGVHEVDGQCARQHAWVHHQNAAHELHHLHHHHNNKFEIVEVGVLRTIR